MWGLILASSVCGLLFGRYFKIYTLIPVVLVIIGLAGVLVRTDGWARGIVSLILAVAAMQCCYFVSAGITILLENLASSKARSKGFTGPEMHLPD